MEAAHADILQQFLAITGADEAAALSVLEACDWQLEGAMELHFAAGGDIGQAGGASGHAPHGIPKDLVSHDPHLTEEEVRAPIPAKMDRLYGDMGMAGMGTGRHGIPPARYGAGPAAHPLAPGPEHVDAFRDFASEAAAAAAGFSSAPRPHGAAGSSSSKAAGSGGAPPASSGPGPAKLSDMFKPPKDLLYAGTFDQAKAEAAQQGRWLLINVQQNEEFDSHRLNRDTWNQPHVQEVVKGMFVFWQMFDSAPEGKRVVGAYHMNQFPVVAIVDPITGSLMYERQGFMSPDTLLEALVPFMDTGPTDPGAGALAHRAVRRKAAGKTAGSSGAAGGGGRRVEGMTEDEQLALALAMSAGGGGAQEQGGATPGTSGAGDDSDDDGIDEAAIWEEIRRREAADKAAAAQAGATPPPAAPSPAPTPASPPPPAPPAVDPDAAAAAAAARLPAEPEAGAAGCSQVAVRLPQGERRMRRFMESDTVGLLRDWVCSLVPEAAAGRAFALSATFPGAPVLSADTSELQLKDAGVAGSLLVLRWTDG